MKAVKHIVVAVMLAVSSAAWADWVTLGGNDKFDVYVDTSTIRKSGDKAKMWHLMDFKTSKELQGDPYLSSKSQSEYDCKDERERTLYFTQHSGQMSDGNVVYSSSGTPSNWTPVSPGSIGESLWKVACGKMG